MLQANLRYSRPHPVAEVVQIAVLVRVVGSLVVGAAAELSVSQPVPKFAVLLHKTSEYRIVEGGSMKNNKILQDANPTL